MGNEGYTGGKLARNAGDIIRGVSALATIMAAVNRYNNMKDGIPQEVVNDIEAGLTDSIKKPLWLYGTGEACNLLYKLARGKKEGEPAVSYFKRVLGKYPIDLASEILKTATVITPLVAKPGKGKTKRGSFNGILIPAAVCIAGHTIGYVNRALGGRQLKDMEAELYANDTQFDSQLEV